MLKVNYITRPWFLDIALELIAELKERVQLNVVLIIAPENASYLGISKEEANQYLDKIVPLEEIINGEAYERLYPYFNGAVVCCKFEQHKETSYKNTLGWFKYLRSNPEFLKADLQILETLSLADWYLLLRIRNKKIFYILHDPVPHTGEGRDREENIKKIYFPYINKFITYSEYSASLFLNYYQDYRKKLIKFKMPVYTNQKVTTFLDYKKNDKKSVLFFGRISAYKGVELFYAAADILAPKYPYVDFIIAGKSIEGYHPCFITDNKHQNIIIKNQFITLAQLNSLMFNADLCVVPYIDATQSGVIMTSYAFNLPVLVSNCEGLLEYCLDNENFSFENQNLKDLTNKLEYLITHPELISSYQQKIDAYNLQKASVINSNLILDNIAF